MEPGPARAGRTLRPMRPAFAETACMGFTGMNGTFGPSIWTGSEPDDVFDNPVANSLIPM